MLYSIEIELNDRQSADICVMSSKMQDSLLPLVATPTNKAKMQRKRSLG
jgi:hypothetical protein